MYIFLINLLKLHFCVVGFLLLFVILLTLHYAIHYIVSEYAAFASYFKKGNFQFNLTHKSHFHKNHLKSNVIKNDKKHVFLIELFLVLLCIYLASLDIFFTKTQFHDYIYNTVLNTFLHTELTQ